MEVLDENRIAVAVEVPHETIQLWERMARLRPRFGVNWAKLRWSFYWIVELVITSFLREW